MSRREFYHWREPRRHVSVGESRVSLPFFYHDNDVFISVHTASLEAVTAELPAEAICPVRWVDGRAMVAVTAFRYHAVTWTGGDGSTGSLVPYGEISVAAVVSVGESARALPLLRREQPGFVLHLPVTTAQARDGGRELWGFPKFVADMDFTEDPTFRRVELSEGGVPVLRLTERPAGPVLPDRRSMVAYSVLDGQLLETTVPVLGHVQARFGSGGGELELGRHQVADRLRALDLSPKPVAVFSYLSHRSILPAGRPIGTARPYAGYRGVDAPLGRFTVSYPGTPPLDQYAAVPVLQQ
ncbi:acetoacetate decarboxylase family protein [Nocardioides mesophilus]|uniref:Acetoacetate decarboxylase family protein n=1 Tax=Nocardioides mesophilus TaxID=433659 RepID=A0A7G9RDX1_9ACTN|nr:acetoacetate decarboxylase family protein [Nocardioides mesophilus]QNN53796.1 acetoacetate decarboxylase family protein [Nocardioides mesophilus]